MQGNEPSSSLRTRGVSAGEHEGDGPARRARTLEDESLAGGQRPMVDARQATHVAALVGVHARVVEHEVEAFASERVEAPLDGGQVIGSARDEVQAPAGSGPVAVEGIDRHVQPDDTWFAAEQLVGAAATVGVQVEHEDAGVPGRQDATCRKGEPLKVQKPSPRPALAWWRPEESDPATPPCANARVAAATAPPLEAATAPKSAGSQPMPFEPARAGGSPVRTASTYAGVWTLAISSGVSGWGDTIPTPGTGSSARESATHAALRVVSNAVSAITYAGS